MGDVLTGFAASAGESQQEKRPRSKTHSAGAGHGRRWIQWSLAGAGVTVLALIAAWVYLRHPSDSVYPERPQPAAAVQATGYDASMLQRQSIEGRRALDALSNNLEQDRTESKAAQPEAPAAQGPLIARNVSFTIVVKNIGAARSALDGLLKREHGYAAEITVSTPENDAANLQASLRIPVSNLPAAISELQQMGRVANESESGEDVTQQHADLEQRLKTARDTEERFRSILEQRTGSVADVLQVEEEIARVRGEIESMEADQTNLQHRVDFATVDLSLTETPIAGMRGSGSLTARLRDALVAGYRHAAATVLGICFFVFEYGLVILLWAGLLGVPLILARRRVKKMRARRQEEAQA